MTEFNYVIKDAQGIHARPAGMLVKTAGKLSSKITIQCNGKEADAKRLLAVMGMGVKCGNEITVKVEGENAEADAAQIKGFLEENL